jgi:hypothetical protein
MKDGGRMEDEEANEKSLCCVLPEPSALRVRLDS